MTSALTPTTDMSFAKRMLWNFRHFQTSSNSIVRASDFDSEGREFESLRARQQLGLQIKGFSQFRVRSYGRFRVADRYCAVLVKSTAYQALPITPRNTVATSGFAVCSLAVWITPLLSAVLHSGMTISGRHRQPSGDSNVRRPRNQAHARYRSGSRCQKSPGCPARSPRLTEAAVVAVSAPQRPPGGCTPSVCRASERAGAFLLCRNDSRFRA
jgi:hypothetical protein